jgi:hypothetical protein
MALADGLLATLMGASILISVQLWRSASLKWAFVLGIVFGLAVLNKAYAVFYYPTPILLWLFLGRTISWRKIAKLLAVTYVTASGAWLLILVVGQLAYQDYLQKKSITGTATEMDFWTRSWNFSLLMGEWLSGYLTLPLIGLLIFVAIRIFLKRDKPGLILILLTIVPLVGFALAFTDLYSRYLFPIIVPLSVLIAWGLDELTGIAMSGINRTRRKSQIAISTSTRAVVQIMMLLLFLLPSAIFSSLIITKPIQAPFPKDDMGSYVVGGQSAQGYKEIAQVMEELTSHQGELIFLRNSLPSPLEIILTVYLADWVLEAMDIVPIGSYEQITPQSLTNYATQAPTLTVDKDFITAHDSNPLIHFLLWRIASFSNPKRPSTIGVYQWLLPPDFAVRWFQQGGDTNPRIAWDASDVLITAPGGELVDWPQLDTLTPEALQNVLIDQDIEYVLVTPSLVSQYAGLFAPFMTTDGNAVTLKQVPLSWQLAFAYPDLNCQWCLFQLKPPEYATHVTFGDAIELEGYGVSIVQLSADKTLYLTLHWHSKAPISESKVVFVHLLDANGKLVAQVDELPLAGQWPTSNWHPGDRLADRHALPLDPALLPGDYAISVGLYDPATLERLSAESEDSLVTDNAVTLTKVSIQ